MNSISFSGGTLIAERDNKEMQFNIEDLYFIYNEDYFNIMLDESHQNSGLAVFSSMYSDLLVNGEAFEGGADELEALVKSHIGGGGGEITIDAALDANSPNAVANSAITQAMNGKVGDIVRQESRVFGEGTTRLSMSKSGGYYDITFAASINNKPILREPYSPYNFSLIETSAITASLSSSSTDSQVPSAKAVYDALGDIETLLSQI